ncbi:uncharacterized protein LOC121057570 isoform X2 [Cygnus olor]|uniref:uncharacterized protein LOC121057570 isoform X2 n=1 Tax=Cygnus olor TaxID=8869 RepID=UPI001ADE4EF9|nr:uncharacterized protein LOC121057570 isoform X2 [Cygnus olor]
MSCVAHHPSRNSHCQPQDFSSAEPSLYQCRKITDNLEQQNCDPWHLALAAVWNSSSHRHSSQIRHCGMVVQWHRGRLQPEQAELFFIWEGADLMGPQRKELVAARRPLETDWVTYRSPSLPDLPVLNPKQMVQLSPSPPARMIPWASLQRVYISKDNSSSTPYPDPGASEHLCTSSFFTYTCPCLAPSPTGACFSLLKGSLVPGSCCQMCCLSSARRTEPQQDTLLDRGCREGWALQGSPSTSRCCQVGNIPGGWPLHSCARGTAKAAPSCAGDVGLSRTVTLP